jgi:hypothetical protein
MEQPSGCRFVRRAKLRGENHGRWLDEGRCPSPGSSADHQCLGGAWSPSTKATAPGGIRLPQDSIGGAGLADWKYCTPHQVNPCLSRGAAAQKEDLARGARDRRERFNVSAQRRGFDGRRRSCGLLPPPAISRMDQSGGSPVLWRAAPGHVATRGCVGGRGELAARRGHLRR